MSTTTPHDDGPRWYHTIADAAPSAFWCLWSGLVGWTVAVFTGDSLKILIGLLTALAGTWIGIQATRARDRIEDERKRRRKAHMALMRFDSLLTAYLSLRKSLRRITDNGKKKFDVASVLPQQDVSEILVGTEQVHKFASVPPEFDDLLDTDEDRKQATVAAFDFHFGAQYFANKVMDTEDLAKSHREAVLVLVNPTIKLIEEHALRLGDAYDHFKKLAT